MNTDSYEEEERRLIDALMYLKGQYERDAAPYIEALARIREWRYPIRVVLTKEQAREFERLQESLGKMEWKK